ncbi:Fimbrillin-A associated anchor proteins Mfa1 and Mfa2 [Histomonas meleagridis]|uniref:Fimbrillin-A associated anchor proteins Mfa1 and Mfa2 n=1 Tax=Histomonas meleagridis TaxID=135588 RepID=UPI00355AA9E2|nr:Fimbrillin-A associated anchor proteins Mfa1 and Mfa2 [Histomonas meleagridis]KAH0802273.1 Fimbrillin-A associated anchor proteins Mfa1 and Mfa2 [Histomonas meleagridis]
MIIGLQSDVSVSELSLFVYDSTHYLCLRKDYTDPRTLASEHIPIDVGQYYIMVVANVLNSDLNFVLSYTDFQNWLTDNSGLYPNMLTASTQVEVQAGEVSRTSLTLEGGTSGITLSTVRLLLTVPGREMPPYTPTRSVNSVNVFNNALLQEQLYLRTVAEVYLQGTDSRVHRCVQLCEVQADGTYLAELSLLPGDYDIRLWSDWTDDGTTESKYYDADDLSAVTVLTDNYTSGTQEKDAYYATPSVSVGDTSADVNVELIRPFARYRIIANDVEAYQKLVQERILPEIENLQIRISYEGFFPTTFNVATGKPFDALTGIGYTTEITYADGYNPDEARQVGSDFVMTDGQESFVTVTVQTVDKSSGEAISTVTGIRIPYRRGQLTTVSGTFLTAGRLGVSGLELDTDWGEDIVVPF